MERSNTISNKFQVGDKVRTTDCAVLNGALITKPIHGVITDKELIDGYTYYGMDYMTEADEEGFVDCELELDG